MSSKHLLVVALTALVAVCAMLAALGFRGRAKVVGIDLGTTYSVVAIRDSKSFHTRVVGDAEGRLLVPSMVAFLREAPRRVLVGHAAAALRFSVPERVIFNAKRFIGRAWEEPALRDVADSHPFRLSRHAANDSEAWFDVGSEAQPWEVSPEEVGAEVIKYLVEAVARDLGHSQVDQAVIAVPADFNARQRRATGEAFRAAGLRIVRVLEEPTAAALAYDLHRKDNVSHILVYDFGGGTLDVSILFVSEGSVQVIASAGDSRLGGSDFDMCLGRHIHGLLSDAQTHERRGCPAGPGASDLLPCGSAVNRALAEQAKILLTDADRVDVVCRRTESSGSDCEAAGFALRRRDFLAVCDDEFRRGRMPIVEALSAADLRPGDIDEVVMVGGTSRIPAVRTLVKEVLRTERLNVDIDPDLTVAIGAASVLD